MAKKTVYIETSIPSWYYSIRTDPKAITTRDQTREWWDNKRSEYELFTSGAVLDELEDGSHPLKVEKLELLGGLPLLSITAEVIAIAKTYCDRKFMPNDTRGDALHVALASHYKCGTLLTWNCLHLANSRKFARLRRENSALGLSVPALLTPAQLLPGGSDA
jgi:hypothetical protein